MKLRLLLAAVAGSTMALATAGLALAAPDQNKKEYVCHYTGSAKNPVVVINVGNPAVFAHVEEPGHGHQGDDQSSEGEPDPADCDEGGDQS
jgi:hypothetical protein